MKWNDHLINTEAFDFNKANKRFNQAFIYTQQSAQENGRFNPLVQLQLNVM